VEGLTVYKLVRCDDCGKDTMVPEDQPLKCDHCQSENVEIIDKIEKDIGFRQ
jgi:Zn finger protein HypA/HybF involved in hydrogenase expression